MKTLTLRSLACLLVVASTVPAAAQSNVQFADIAGWWSADPVHGGESSHIAMHFVEKDGKQEARLWLMGIGAYDINLGEVALSGNSIDTKGLSFPLTWNPADKTLSGHLPADAAPVYNIPIEFKRGPAIEKPPAREWKASRPRVVWSVDTGAAVWAGLELSSEGMLFVGNEQGDLHAIDSDGKVKWKFSTGKPIRAQPKVVGAHVYVASDSGFLYKLDRKSGAETWRAKIDHGSEPRIPTNQEKTRWDRYGSSVVTDGQRLFVASRDKNLYALDVASGGELWRVAGGDIMTATPAMHGGNVIFGAFDGKVNAVSARDGTPRWSYDAKLAVSGDVIVAGDRVLLGSRTYDLIALDAATGKEQWKHYYWFSWIESPPLVRDGVIYTGSSDGKIVCALNLADGSLRWKTTVPGWSWSRTAVNDDFVVAGTVGAGAWPGSLGGSLMALDRATGAPRWIYLDPPSEENIKNSKAWGFGASPVITGNVVLAADLGGRVHALELR